MRWLLPLLALAATPAFAAKRPPKVAGEWEIKFQSVANTCKDTGYTLGAEVMTVRQKGKAVETELALFPILKGNLEPDGKFRAARKRGPSGIEGLNGEFQMTGAFAGDAVDVVIVAQYFVGDDPLCQQSWNGKGSKKK